MNWDRCSRIKFVHSDLAHTMSERKKTEDRNVEQISFVSSLVFHALLTGGEQTLTLLDQSNISLCPRTLVRLHQCCERHSLTHFRFIGDEIRLLSIIQAS